MGMGMPGWESGYLFGRPAATNGPFQVDTHFTTCFAPRIRHEKIEIEIEIEIGIEIGIEIEIGIGIGIGIDGFDSVTQHEMFTLQTSSTLPPLPPPASDLEDSGIIGSAADHRRGPMQMKVDNNKERDPRSMATQTRVQKAGPPSHQKPA